ncbi:hypothetical protein B296_00036933 [Ensete ventricosum]|uniref:ATP synthase subunit epsilon, mitochondrial n=1 Tax=Ensete ventricosum TaxID=4639 RepID=A0A426Y4V7_ENSVE|nr:hypothetical protein B296_00036933 [Ensete ventricosum]
MASATAAAVPFWRAAGMTYITYSNICASIVRSCLKEPYKSETAGREKIHFAVTKWANGKPEKPGRVERIGIGTRDLEREGRMLLSMESVVARPSSFLGLKPRRPLRYLRGLGFGGDPLIARVRWRSLDLSVAIGRNGALSTNSVPVRHSLLLGWTFSSCCFRIKSIAVWRILLRFLPFLCRSILLFQCT